MHRTLLFLLALVFPAFAQDVRITEFLPVNTTGLQDQDATYQPWIELWNPGTSVVTFTQSGANNWRLVHNGSTWNFPNGFQIPPGEYVVVFASGKNKTAMASPLHTNFTLKPDGGVPLQLLRADNSVASTFSTYPALAPNVSYGRDGAEGAQVGSYTNPTPGDANNYSGSGVAGKVTISQASRAYTGFVSVTLSEVTPVAGTTIRYTTNGLPPTSSSTAYNPALPINITSTALLRARVFEPGKLPGEIESAGYLLLDGTTSGFNTAAPLIVVSNFGLGTIPDAGDQPAFMWVWEPGADGRARFTNPPTLATRCAVDRRGSSTGGNAKTNFNLEARKARDDDDRDVTLLNLGTGSDWVFHAPFFYDPSLLHNPFMYALSNAIGRAAMRTRMAEVFVETSGGALNYSGGGFGDYFGVYNVMQKIRRAPDRIDIQKLDTYDNAPTVNDGGYIMKIDRRDAGDTGFIAGGIEIQYYYPKEVEMKTPQRDPQELALTTYINAFKAALDSPGYANPTTGYAKYLDVPALIDHHLLNVWSFNVDALRLSGYFHKDRGGKIVYGPVWDFDRALFSQDGRDSNPATWRSTSGDLGTDFFNFTPWISRIFTDLEFYQKYIDRWVELRRGTFSPTAVNALLDSLNAEITTEGVTRDLARWGQGKRAWTSPFTGISYPNSTPAQGQAAEVQRIKDYLQQRANFFDTEWVRPVTFNVDGGSVAVGSTLTLAATTPGSTIYYTLDGTDPRPTGGAVPNSANVFTYTGPITVNAITRVKARAYSPSFVPPTGFDRTSKPPLMSKWSGLRDVRVAIEPAAVPGNLAVTEVNYHPKGATAAELAIDPTFKSSDFEFIELKNISGGPIDLAGLQVTIGANFTFTNDAALTLPAGAYVIIADNPAAFAARYGNVANVVGGFSGDLNNLGEQVVIRSAANAVIADFTYDDVWYPTTDGDGRSLEGLNQAQLNVAAGWRASLRDGGSPGFEDILSTISEDPVGTTVNPGQPIELRVTATGSPAPIYQWRKDGEAIEGATSATYSVLSVTEANQGTYDVAVQNYSGTVISAPAVVNVNDPVVFSAPPLSRAVNPGTLVVLEPTVTGTAPFTYQWRKGGVPIDGATQSTLQFTATEAVEGSYDVVITNIVGSATSDPAVLTVNDPVVITTDPTPVRINPAGIAKFTVAATGTGPLEYQWRKGGEPIAGAIGAELTISPVSEGDQGTYDVIVSNAVGPVTSAAVALDVNDPVQIATPPLTQAVNPGELVTLSVVVNGTAPFTYQWRKNGTPIDGATSAELALGAAVEEMEGSYDVIVTNEVGPQTSAPAVVTVNDTLHFTSQPISRVVSPGGSVSFSVAVTGENPVAYQWRRNGVPISGATDSSVQISGVSSGELGTYDVVATNAAGSATSATATLSFINLAQAAGAYQGALVRAGAANPREDLYPGRVTANLTKTGKLTGKLDYMGLTHPFKAQLDLSLHAQTSVARRNDSAVALVLDLSSATGELAIDATEPGIDGSASADAPHIPKRARGVPPALAGHYTMLLRPGADSPTDMTASGFLALNIAASGTTSWVGKLPDTSPVKGSALLSPGNDVAFYTPLYVKSPQQAGHVAGPLTVEAAGFTGDLGWRKPPQTKGDYWRAGLATFLENESSPWVAGARGVPVLPPGAMTFTLENNFSGTDAFPVSFTSLGKFVFAGTTPKLVLNRTTGLVTGSHKDFTGKSRPVYGAVLQNQVRGEGFSPGTAVTRPWVLAPVAP